MYASIYGFYRSGEAEIMTVDERNTLLAAVRAYQRMIRENVSASPDSEVAWLNEIATDSGDDAPAPTIESLDDLAERWLGGA